MPSAPKILDVIADRVLRYRPKPAGHLLPAQPQIGSGPISEAERRKHTEGQWPMTGMAPDTGNPPGT